MKITADIISSTGLVGFLSKVVYTEAKPEKKEEKQNEGI